MKLKRPTAKKHAEIVAELRKLYETAADAWEDTYQAIVRERNELQADIQKIEKNCDWNKDLVNGWKRTADNRAKDHHVTQGKLLLAYEERDTYRILLRTMVSEDAMKKLDLKVARKEIENAKRKETECENIRQDRKGV